MTRDSIEIILICVNNNTQRTVEYKHNEFAFGQIEWNMEVQPVMGYSRIVSADEFTIIKEDKAFVDNLFNLYGKYTNIIVRFKYTPNVQHDFALDVATITITKNTTTFGLIASGLEANFAKIKNSTITLPETRRLYQLYGYRFNTYIRHKDFKYTDENADERWAQNLTPYTSTTEDSILLPGFILEPDTVMTVYAAYLRHKSYKCRIDAEWELGMNVPDGTKLYVYLVTWEWTLGEQYTMFPNHIFLGSYIKEGTKFRVKADFDYIMPTPIYSLYNRRKYVLRCYTDPNELWPSITGFVDCTAAHFPLKTTIFVRDTQETMLSRIGGTKVSTALQSIFGDGNVQVTAETKINDFYIVNASNTNQDQDNPPQCTFKISDLIHDLCIATGSVFTMRDGKYNFETITQFFQNLNAAAVMMDEVKDVEISTCTDLDFEGVTAGAKLPSNKVILNDRDQPFETLTFASNANGKYLPLTINKFRIDYSGLYDNEVYLREKPDSTASKDNYLVPTIGGYIQILTYSADAQINMFPQPCAFNLSLMPKQIIKKHAGIIKSIFSDQTDPAGRVLSLLEQDNVDNQAGLKSGNITDMEKDNIIIDAMTDSQLFTTRQVKMTALLTSQNFLSIFNKPQTLKFHYNNQLYSIMPTKISVSPLNYTEADVEGIIINIIN